MGLFERFASALTKQAQAPLQQAPQETVYLDDPYGGQLGGQPVNPYPVTTIPPQFEREVMELFLKPQFPQAIKEIDPNTGEPYKLRGRMKYWPILTEFATTVQTGNLNAHRQKVILNKIQIAKDFEGCDDIEGLVESEMIDIAGEVFTGKARSDLTDGVRDRLASNTGVGLSGSFQQPGKEGSGERPRESRALFGLLGRNRQQ